MAVVAPDEITTTIAHVIQLAVAPVFLLTGIGSMLGVLTNRLARIIDRARQWEAKLAHATEEERGTLTEDLRILSRRARLVNWAISLCTTCALFICTVVVVLFLQSLLEVHFRGVVASLFIVAMCAFILGLLFFLREIYVATRALRIGPRESR